MHKIKMKALYKKYKLRLWLLHKIDHSLRLKVKVDESVEKAIVDRKLSSEDARWFRAMYGTLKESLPDATIKDYYKQVVVHANHEYTILKKLSSSSPLLKMTKKSINLSFDDCDTVREKLYMTYKMMFGQNNVNTAYEKQWNIFNFLSEDFNILALDELMKESSTYVKNLGLNAFPRDPLREMALPLVLKKGEPNTVNTPTVVVTDIPVTDIHTTSTGKENKDRQVRFDLNSINKKMESSQWKPYLKPEDLSLFGRQRFTPFFNYLPN